MVDQPRHRDREIDRDAAVRGARVELAGEGRRHPQRDAAVDGLEVESWSVPSFAGELDVQAAVDRFAANIPADVVQLNAAVDGVRIDAAAQVLDVDAAVGRVDAQLGFARYL